MRGASFVLVLAVLGGCLDVFESERAVDEGATYEEARAYIGESYGGGLRFIGAIAMETGEPANSDLAALQSLGFRANLRPDAEGINGLSYSWTYFFVNEEDQLVRSTISGTAKGWGTTIRDAEEGHVGWVARGALLGDYSLNSTQAVARVREANETWEQRLAEPTTDLILALFRPAEDSPPYWLLTAWERHGAWGGSLLVDADDGSVRDPTETLFPEARRQDFTGIGSAIGAENQVSQIPVEAGYARIILHAIMRDGNALSSVDITLTDGDQANLRAELSTSRPEASDASERPKAGPWMMTIRAEGLQVPYSAAICLDNDADLLILSPGATVREPEEACPVDEASS